MAKTIFAGRKNFNRDFTEYLVGMASEGKESRLFPSFRKKKDDDETYPRIFLLCGGAGTGKSAMAGQWIEMSRGIGSEIKKPIKVVTLDCEEILSKNMMMLGTLIEALHGAFSNEELGSTGYFSEYAHIERRIEHVHEKVEQLCKREWSPDGAPPKETRHRPEGAGNERNGSDDGHGASEEQLKDTAFTHWLRGNGKLPEDELDLYENSDYRLSKALVNGIIQLSADYPVVVAIDGFDHMHNKEIEEWLRTVFLGKLYQRKNRVMVIISGRGNFLRNFRNDFPETLLYAIKFDDYPLTLSNIADCAQACQVKLSAGEIRDIEEITGGIPFIVRDVLGLVKDKVPVREILDAGDRSPETADRAAVLEIHRFLKQCPNNVLKKKIIHCSLMRQLESNVLAKLWNVAYADVGALLTDFAARYPFIVTVKNGHRGNAMLRDYLIKENSAGKDSEIVSIIKEFSATASPLFASQVAQLRTAIATVDKRYDDERFTETLLAYSNALLWNERDALFEMLPGVFLECLQYNSAFAVRLLQCIDEFRPLLTGKQANIADTFISGILSSHPMSMWLGMVPSPEETAMLKLIEDNSAHCTDLQIALLRCRQGELQYRLGDYDQACGKFESCIPLAEESEGLKKTLLDDFCSLGTRLFDAGNNDAVVRVYRFVTMHRPENHEAWYTLGKAQTALGLTGESAVSYVKALELKPDLHDAWYRLGLAYHTLESFQQAVEALNNVLGMDAGNAHAWHILGRSYRALERFEEAARSLTKAVEIEPENKEAWTERGEAQAALQRYEEACVSFEKAVQIDGKLHRAWFALGQANYRLGLFPKAVAAFESAIERAPNNKEYIYNMALACHAAGDFDQAVRNWGKVMELDPANNQALYQMALSLHAQGQYSDAIQLYKQAAAGLPKNIEVFLNTGRAYHAQGLFNDAVDMYRKALQIDPAEPEVWDDMGLVFTAMGLYGDAIQAYKELTRIAPDWDHAWRHLGDTYYLIRHYENALQSYEKVVELNPKDYLAWGSLGQTHYTLGAYDKAIDAGSRALALKPGELWIQSNCAMSTLLSGNIEGAKAEYDKVMGLAKTRDELTQQIAALEGVLAHSPHLAQAGEILVKLKDALKERA
jgi:tetratricopeptide (TPR) repeat protein